MPRGYEEGPVAEAAEARRDALERGEPIEPELLRGGARLAVIGSTEDNQQRHFLGWADEVDPDELFASGRAWGLSIVRKQPD